MLCAVLVTLLMPFIFASTNEGNLHLLEEEVAAAIRSCTANDSTKSPSSNQRPKRSGSHAPKIDSSLQRDTNLYGHERRSTDDTTERIHVLNATDYDYGGYGSGNAGEKLVTEMTRTTTNRTKRHEPLINNPDSEQCLSQCVFANLQVVDIHGIPREAELWSLVQAAVTSQQSRVALRDQVRVCFQELQSEAEDDGCSYSNQLERCLMLQFEDRKIGRNDTAKT